MLRCLRKVTRDWLVLVTSLVQVLVPATLAAQYSNSVINQLLDNPKELAKNLEISLAAHPREQNSSDWAKYFYQLQQANYEAEFEVPFASKDITSFDIAIRAAELSKSSAMRIDLERLKLYALSQTDDFKNKAKSIQQLYNKLLADPELASHPNLKALIVVDAYRFLRDTDLRPFSISYLETAQRLLLESTLDDYAKIKIYDAISQAYYDEGRLEESKEYDLKVYESCKKNNWRARCAGTTQNLAMHYIRLEQKNDNRKALPYLQESEALALAINDSRMQADVAYSYLRLYQKLEQTELALEFGTKARELYTKLDDKAWLSYTNLQIAHAYASIKKHSETINAALEGLRQLENNDYPRRLELEEILAKAYEAKGDTTQAFVHLKNYLVCLEDKIQKREAAQYSKQLATLGHKVQEEKNISLSKELASKDRMNRLALGFLALSLLSLGLVLALLRQSQRARRSQRMMRSIMDHLEIGIVSLNHELKIDGEYASSLHQLFHHPESFQNEDFLSILESRQAADQKDFASIRFLLQNVIGLQLNESLELLQQIPQDFILSGPEGLRHLTIHWQAICDSSQITQRILISLLDVSREKELRSEVNAQQQKLINLGEMTASIAHDIASPSYLLSNTNQELTRECIAITELIKELLGDDEDPEVQDVRNVFNNHFLAIQASLGASKLAIERIIAVQAAIRNQARNEQKPEPFLLKNLILECLTLSRANARTFKIQIDIPEHLEFIGFRSQLGQVISNLVNNAFDALKDYTSSEAREWDLRIAAASRGDFFEITVEDAGPGISKDMRERIFEPYFTTKPLGVGTGLGLPICRRIIKQHKGTLTVDTGSVLGGACFRILVPLSKEEAA